MEPTGHVVRAFLLLVAVALTFAVNPGFNMRVTQKGIQYANTIAAAAIKQKLQTLNIPDQDGKEGKLTWSLSGIQNRGITGPYTNIAFSPAAGGVTVTLSNFGVNLHADWRVKYKLLFPIRASGSIDASVSGVSLSVTVGLGERNGRPSVSPRSCSANIGGVNIKFHGGLVSFVLNMFRGKLERKLKDLLQSKVCSIVNDAINGQANEELAKLKVDVTFARKFGLDYGLVAPPVVTGTYLETRHKGEIYWKDNRQPSQVPQPSPMSISADVSRMAILAISEYTANTFADAAQRNGFLKYKLNINDIPAVASFFQGSQPGSDIQLNINSTSSPKVKMENQKLTVSVYADVEVVMATPGGAPSILALNMSVSLTIQPSIANEKLVVAVANYSKNYISTINAFPSFDVNILRSDMGEIDPQELKTLLREAFDQMIIPGLNSYVSEGIDLPVTGSVKFNNVNLQVQPGALVISTDVQKL